MQHHKKENDILFLMVMGRHTKPSGCNGAVIHRCSEQAEGQEGRGQGDRKKRKKEKTLTGQFCQGLAPLVVSHAVKTMPMPVQGSQRRRANLPSLFCTADDLIIN